jgi:CelD/BcsL family acetyltransferase involved in cellulose biosynthesis
MNAIDMPRRAFVAAPSDFAVEIHSGNDLAAVDWPSIAGPAELRMFAFQAREFLDVWINTIGAARGSECYLVVVKDGQRPVLYLPLAIETVFKVRLLRFMDAGVSDYNAPILSSPHDLTETEFHRVWSQILESLPKFDAIDLQKIAGDIEGRFNPLTYLASTPYASSGHSLRLAALQGKVDPRVSMKKQIKSLRRRERALNARGRVDFVVNPDGAMRNNVLDRLLRLKRQTYMRIIGRDFLGTPGVTAFYREMAEPHRLRRISHLSATLFNDQVVAAHLGFIGRGRLHYILPAYDTAYRRYGVGHLLLQHLIDRSFDQHLAAFDLGVGDFSYKARWETDRLPLSCHERPQSFTGLLYLQMRRAHHRLGTAALRQWLRV